LVIFLETTIWRSTFIALYSFPTARNEWSTGLCSNYIALKSTDPTQGNYLLAVRFTDESRCKHFMGNAVGRFWGEGETRQKQNKRTQVTKGSMQLEKSGGKWEERRSVGKRILTTIAVQNKLCEVT
jgi:hypothetical protein